MFDFSNMFSNWDWSGMDLSNLTTPQLDYEALAAIAVQAAVISPAVVDTPANVAPKAAAVEKVITDVIKAVAPDDDTIQLRPFAKQVAKAVVTNPAIIAAPAGQTVNTTTIKGIIEASGVTSDAATKPDPARLASLSGKRLSESDGDAYYTAKVGNTGKTSAQLDAADNAAEVAKSTGGVIDKVTGKIYPKGTSQTEIDRINATEEAKAASKKAAQEKALAEAKAKGEADRQSILSQQGQKVTTPLTGTSSAGMNATSSATSEKFGGFETALEQSLGRDIGSSVNYNAKIDEQVAQAQAVAAKPIMSAAQKAGGGVVKWIGGVSGKWEIVMPIGSPLVGSKAAGYEPNRNPPGVESGVSPTGIIPGVGATVPIPGATTTTPTTTTPTTTTPTTTTPTTTTPVTTTPTTTTATTSTVTDPNTALIKQLQEQIAALTKQITATTSATTTSAAYNDRMSVYASMADRFNKYGLTGLANKIKELAMQGATEATITLQLQETPEYQQRFAANADRLKKGLAALTPAEYVNVEDSYRQVLRAYGLKQFDNDAYVKQFIANDMSPTEFSNRIVTAVQRVQNADPAIVKQLKDYYGIGVNDMVGYVLDPEQQFQKIERQIAASEIGVAAGRQGLKAGVSVAEQLASQGVTEAEARKGYSTIADILPTSEKLSDIYGTTLDEYRQAEGEQEVFNSLASAQRKREALKARELAAFSGSSGTNKASLTTSNVGQF